MKKYICFLYLCVIFMTLTACSHDEISEFNEVNASLNMNESLHRKDSISFTLSFENILGTRTYMSDDYKQIYWGNEDKISVFDGIDNCEFYLSKGSGTTSCIFSGVASVSDTYTLVYPYTANAKLLDNGNVEGIEFLYDQKAHAGSFDPRVHFTMTKTSSFSSYTIYNTQSLIKFQTDFDCSRVVLRPSDNNMALAGMGTIQWNDGLPYIDFYDSNEKSFNVGLSGDILAGQTYYITIPPGTLSGGWNITFVSSSDNKIYKRRSNNSITFNRSKTMSLGTFSKDATYWVDSEQGIVSADQEVDLGLEITQDDKKYKVIFAKSNLTTFGLAANESDFGDYFAWGAIEPWCTSYEYSSGDTFIAKTWMKGKEEEGYTKDYVPSYDGNFLKAPDDAARVILGGNWQTPSKEILNLLNKCSCEWTTINNVSGYKFTNNDNTLFLPAAGQFDKNMYCESVGVLGCYRTNTSNNTNKNSDYFVFQSSSINQISDNWRKGCTIRPVRLVEITTE